MFRKNADLFVVVTLTNIAAAASLIGFMRPLALPLVLILPGYALMVALFPASMLQSFQLILCSVALSLVLMVLTGLALNLTQPGLQSQTWLIALYALIMCLTFVSYFRRRKTLETTFVHLLKIPPLNARQLALIGLAVIIVLVALKISSTSAMQPDTSFVQLWILPKAAASSRTVEIGMQNIGPQSGSYDLVLVHGPEVLQRWSAVNLEANAEWTTEVSVPPQVQGGSLEVMLYRAGSMDNPYRYVRLWLGDAQ